MLRKLLTLIVVSTGCSLAIAEVGSKKMNEADALRQQGYAVKVITQIYSQLVAFSFPKGFTPVFEDVKGGQYIQESVLNGESIKKWSQMITITGAKGLASSPNLTPIKFAGGIAGGFKRVCPDSYSATGLGEIKLGPNDAFVAVVSCGTANTTAEPYSEAMLLIIVKGENDYYTIQWAERGTASKTPIPFDGNKWGSRIKMLRPIKLCPVVPGEKPPYPSCASQT